MTTQQIHQALRPLVDAISLAGWNVRLNVTVERAIAEDDNGLAYSGWLATVGDQMVAVYFNDDDNVIMYQYQDLCSAELSQPYEVKAHQMVFEYCKAELAELIISTMQSRIEEAK